MNFDLDKCRLVVRAAAKLNNFFVGFQEETVKDINAVTFSETTPYFKHLVCDARSRGRPTTDKSHIEVLGVGTRKRHA